MTSAILLLLLLPLLTALVARAQDLDDATIAGVISDERRASIPGATVRIESATGFARTTQTDDQGRYRFVDVAPGDYQLRAAINGFTPTDVLT
ncbi:MAG: carboxypeptidase-like regulatory domain-containing protein [Pyrinomonadaceae bacterium]